jgi:hypothetical protein
MLSSSLDGSYLSEPFWSRGRVLRLAGQPDLRVEDLGVGVDRRHDRVEDLLTRNRQEEGLADGRVLEHLGAEVQVEVVVGDLVTGHDLSTRDGLERLLRVGGCLRVDEVDLAVLQSRDLRGGVADDTHDELVDLRREVALVVGVVLERQRLTRRPGRAPTGPR